MSRKHWAVLTFAMVMVAFAALDDITTNADSSFALERAALVACSVWFIATAWRLVRQGHAVLGGLSLGVIAAAALAQPAIGPGTVPSLRWEYLATIGALAWFVAIAGVLARPSRRIATPSAAR